MRKKLIMPQHLRDSSDTGLSQSDNITKATAPVFDILNVIPGARVELLRNNEVVSSAIAASLSLPSFSVSLTDSSPPLDGVVQYSSRQIIAGVTSAVSPSISVAFDNTAPTVTINQAASQTDPATRLPQNSINDIIFYPNLKPAKTSPRTLHQPANG